ncbi:MAG: hypothetical protein WA604_15185 [Candidatus Sulfotelmatobacter sp.]
MNWIRKIATRFKKGIEYVVEKGLQIVGAYEAAKKAVTFVKTAAPNSPWCKSGCVSKRV